MVGDLDEGERSRELRARRAKEMVIHEMFTTIRKAAKPEAAFPDPHCCSEASTRIIEEVEEAHQVTLGRTSFRLRNPKNAPPAWAQSRVASQTDRSAVFRHGDGRIAALYPMRMQMACLPCHGTAEDVPADLQKELAKLYPDDAALGFTYPGIRGYVWVEVGPSETTPLDQR